MQERIEYEFLLKKKRREYLFQAHFPKESRSFSAIVFHDKIFNEFKWPDLPGLGMKKPLDPASFTFI